MSICLKTYSKYKDVSSVQVTVQERLPEWIESSCVLNCVFSVKLITDYYVLNLTIKGDLPITCQRCLKQVDYVYSSTVEIALCRTEERANQLMSSYDCIVIDTDFLDLEAIVTDEIHLSTPQIPHEDKLCQWAF